MFETLVLSDRVRAIEARLDELAAASGLVEVDLCVGEEPEAGVEFEVTTACGKFALTEHTPCVLPPTHEPPCHFQAPFQRPVR